jgi:PilZ domain
MPEAARLAGSAAAIAASTAPGRDLRESPRYTLLMRAAKLVSRDGEFLCVVRDASETGVNIRLFHRLPDNDFLNLEFPNGDRHRLELVWQQDDRAGLKFVETADIGRLLEGPSRYTKRPIRVNLDMRVLLSAGTQTSEGRLIDLSQQGAKVLCGERFAIDQRIRLSGPSAAMGLPDVNAKVRWRRENAYGLVFEDTFQFGDLAHIVAKIQHPDLIG